MSNLSPNLTQTRIRSVDILRGVIMILMAIDHVRVYAGVPAGGPEPAVFFTRWVTHFCAPGFVFLTGVSAFLYGQKVNNKNALSFFLLTRGLLLVLLELTVIRFFWTFNFDYATFTLAGVIWMIGWCMIIMAALVKLKPMFVGITGLVIIFAQQVFSRLPEIIPAGIHKQLGWFWEFIYPSGLEAVPGITILYVIVPWIGVMAAGYGFGIILLKDKKLRNRICLWAGVSATLLFVIIGTIITYNDTKEGETMPFILRLLNQRKYPASFLYLLMTLGPLIAFVPYTEKAKGWLANILTIFGRVPMFYYILHILLIHSTALLVNYISTGNTYQEFYFNAPYAWLGPDKQWSLGLLYFVFIADVTLLYFVCKWYAKYKLSNPDKGWLKYI